jgi:hypothetical protein
MTSYLLVGKSTISRWIPWIERILLTWVHLKISQLSNTLHRRADLPC